MGRAHLERATDRPPEASSRETADAGQGTGGMRSTRSARSGGGSYAVGQYSTCRAIRPSGDVGEGDHPGRLHPVGHGHLADRRAALGDQAVDCRTSSGQSSWGSAPAAATKLARPTIRSPEHGQSIRSPRRNGRLRPASRCAASPPRTARRLRSSCPPEVGPPRQGRARSATLGRRSTREPRGCGESHYQDQGTSVQLLGFDAAMSQLHGRPEDRDAHRGAGRLAQRRRSAVG